LTTEDVEVYKRLRPVMAQVDELEQIHHYRKQLLQLLQQDNLPIRLLDEYFKLYGEVFDPYHTQDKNKHIYQMAELMYKKAIAQHTIKPSMFRENLLD
jgi:hypothetical protein